jgi:hypothetical protein
MKAAPAAPDAFWRFSTAFVTTSRAGPGARPARLSTSDCVVDSPSRPRIDTSTSSAGNSDSTP